MLENPDFKNEECKFFVDSGADISVVKCSSLQPNTYIDTRDILEIKGVTPGKTQTLGRAQIPLLKSQCKIHVVPDSFPIDTEGLLGWDVINELSGCIDAAAKHIRLSNIIIPFVVDERISIPSRVRRVIIARVKNNVKVGWVPLMNLHPKILFGNFIAENHEGEIYAECINVSHEAVEISVPEVELQPCETVRIQHPVRAGEDGSSDNELANAAHLRRLFCDTEEVKYKEVQKLNTRLLNDEKPREERVQKIMQLVDVEDCNNEEISEIREIINEFSGVFGLEGEPLPATHLIKHNIQLISNTSINTRRYRYPPALKEQIQNEIDKLLEQDIIEPSNSNYSSAMWIVPKKVDAQENKK